MSIRAVYGAPPPPDSNRYAKRYLGDGVYVEHDGYQLWLTTSNGICDTNKIALDDEVLQALLEYVTQQRLRGQ